MTRPKIEPTERFRWDYNAHDELQCYVGVYSVAEVFAIHQMSEPYSVNVFGHCLHQNFREVEEAKMFAEQEVMKAIQRIFWVDTEALK